MTLSFIINTPFEFFVRIAIRIIPRPLFKPANGDPSPCTYRRNTCVNVNYNFFINKFNVLFTFCSFSIRKELGSKLCDKVPQLLMHVIIFLHAIHFINFISLIYILASWKKAKVATRQNQRYNVIKEKNTL